MKRLLTYLFLVLGLFWCNFEVANSKESINICYNTSTGVTYLATFKCDEYIDNKQVSLKEYLLVNVKYINNRHDIKDLNKKLKIAQTEEEKKIIRRKIFRFKSIYFKKFINGTVRYFDQNEVLKALPSSISNFDRQLLAEAFIHVAKSEKARKTAERIKDKKRREVFTKKLDEEETKKLLNADDLIKILNQLTGYYKIFAYSSKGEVFWGWSVQNKKNTSLQSGGIISSLGYQCMLFLYEEKNSAPFNGKFNSICGNKNYSFGGTWKQHSKTHQGYGEGSRKDGEKITFYFDKDAKSFRAAINTYFLESLSTQTQQVAEQEQEEFKPKKKDIDNDPPRIEIAEAITVVSQSYTIKGTVRDKSQIYLTIDGRQVEVKKGKFKVDRFNIDPDVAEEIKIVAIDKWNNRSEKIVKVTVELQSTEVVRTYEELKPNRIKVSKDKNKIAIIIGIEKYKNMTECNYCNRDAKAFKVYATRALGVIPSNIISLIGSKATRGEILRAFKISLPRIAGDGGKDINIFFAGHGLASESGEELYIIPQDGDESLLEDTAISRVELIKLIKKVDPKSVTMFFDTCYSGQTRGEQMLVASLRGIRIVEAGGIPDNFTIFTASSSNQGSSHIEEAKQGIFSYYLMKGLEGKADEDKNKEITNGELIAYLKTNVSREAFSQAREQDPMLSGDPDQVLMKYR